YSRRRHTSWPRDWSSDVCSSDLGSRNGGPDHRPPFREPRQALSPDGPDRQLLVLRRELHGVVRRSPCGARGVLVPGVRAVLVGRSEERRVGKGGGGGGGWGGGRG